MTLSLFPRVVENPWGGKTPRPWQAEALPIALEAYEQGTKGVLRACTGAGKSILIAEIMAHLVHRLHDHERIIVTCPTQNLVQQLHKTISARVGEDYVGCYYQHRKDLDTPIIVTCHASAWDGLTACSVCHEELLAKGRVRILECDDLYEANGQWRTAQIELDAAKDRIERLYRQRAQETLGPARLENIQDTIELLERKVRRIESLKGRCRQPFEHYEAAGISYFGKLSSELAERELKVALWFADECHKTESAQCQGFAQWTQIDRIMGCTATPWRSNIKERLTLFDVLLYDYGPTRAIADGVVLMPTVIPYVGEGERELNDACLEMIQAHLTAHPGPGIVSAASCEDADEYAAYLKEHDVRAEVVHSKLKPGLRDERVKALQNGELDCLVHVNMLAEGVDLPWLEWLCMRRKVQRVRFVQEAGRVLRTYPGKLGAWILDPLHQWSRMGLDAEAVLGAEREKEASELERAAIQISRALSEEDEEGEGGTIHLVSPAAMDEIAKWLYIQSVNLGLWGYTERTAYVLSESARTKDMSERQAQYVGKLTRKIKNKGYAENLDETTRSVLRSCTSCARLGLLPSGQASDLIDVLKVIADKGELPTTQGGDA